MNTLARRAALLSITPLVPAGPDLAEAIRFYTERLGFTLAWRADAMAGLRRGRVELNLVQNDTLVWANNCSASVGVDDLDALSDEYRAALPELGPPAMRAWGRRELHLILPSGVCLQFYQAGE